MEEIVRYLAETQRLMADNIVQLTQVQVTQQEQLNTIVINQQQQEEKHLEAEQKQRETDERFNVLLEEVRYLIRNMNQNQE